MTIEIAIFSAVIIGVLAGLMLENLRRRIDPVAAGPAVPKEALLRLTGPGSAPSADSLRPRAVDSATALRLVSDAGFASRPLLSGREADVLAAVESIASEAGLGWRVVPQVRLVDILASSDADANAVIGDHRIDMLVVSAARMPVAAVDYQSMGQLRDDAALNDAVKREALRRADIPFIEIRANEPIDTLRSQLLRLAAPVPAARSRAAPKAAPVAAKIAVAKVVTAKVVSSRTVARPAARHPARAAAPAVRAPAKTAAKPAPAPAPAATAKPAPAKLTKTPAAKPPAPVAAKPAPVTAKAPPAAVKPAAKPAAKPAPAPATKAPAKASKPAPKAKPTVKDPPAEP